jgi:hypothetical protein
VLLDVLPYKPLVLSANKMYITPPGVVFKVCGHFYLITIEAVDISMDLAWVWGLNPIFETQPVIFLESLL